MKNVLFILSFVVAGANLSFAKEFSCPDKFDLSFQNVKYPDFEVYPKEANYSFLSAILYSGHPKELGALKGKDQMRKKKNRPFWLVCNYKVNESISLGHTLTKKIPAEYTYCKYTNSYKGIDCK